MARLRNASRTHVPGAAFNHSAAKPNRPKLSPFGATGVDCGLSPCLLIWVGVWCNQSHILMFILIFIF
jgi:hypothetical protein